MDIWQETLSVFLSMAFVEIGAILLDYSRGTFRSGATCESNKF